MVEVLVKSEYTEGSRVIYPEWTLAALAQKLERITGVPPEMQRLVITAPNGNELLAKTRIDLDMTQLQAFDIPEFSEVLVEDTRTSESQLNLDAEGPYAVPRLTEEEYAKRPNTLLQYKKEHKLGRFADNYAPTVVTAAGPVPTPADVMVNLGDECIVTLKTGQSARGTVAFIGEVANIEQGAWVGINLFTPDGRNNGVVAGTKLFDAKPNHGVLVRPSAVRPLEGDEEEL